MNLSEPIDYSVPILDRSEDRSLQSYFARILQHASSNPRSIRRPIATNLSILVVAHRDVPILDRSEDRSLHGTYMPTNYSNWFQSSIDPKTDRYAGKMNYYCQFFLFQSSIDPKTDRYRDYPDSADNLSLVPILDRSEDRSLLQSIDAYNGIVPVPILDRSEDRSLLCTCHCINICSRSNPRSIRRPIATGSCDYKEQHYKVPILDRSEDRSLLNSKHLYI